jgi:prepilin-type N-terminal cleavage/methylation domain-containing protein/prepilin-type processing-associated H-X9-DG protein
MQSEQNPETFEMAESRGFTLVELLVVIAIIALLMSILMPALSRARKQAKDVLCQSRLKQWGAIFAMYTGEHDGYFSNRSQANNSGYWVESLRSYYADDPQMRCCPTATKPWTEGGQGTFSAWGIFKGPPSGPASLWGMRNDYGSFAINSWVYNPPPEVTDMWGHPTEDNWRSANVKGANRIPLFFDCWWFDTQPLDTDEPPEFDGDIYSDSGEIRNSMKSACINRHNGYIDMLFLDFSVGKVGLKELWHLAWHKTFNLSGPWTIAGGVTQQDWPEWMRQFRDY